MAMFMQLHNNYQYNYKSRWQLHFTFHFYLPAPQAGWKENHATFLAELKTLEATSVSSFGWALKQSFDLLNTHRLHTSIDHYGQVPAQSVAMHLKAPIHGALATCFKQQLAPCMGPLRLWPDIMHRVSSCDWDSCVCMSDLPIFCLAVYVCTWKLWPYLN